MKVVNIAPQIYNLTFQELLGYFRLNRCIFPKANKANMYCYLNNLIILTSISSSSNSYTRLHWVYLQGRWISRWQAPVSSTSLSTGSKTHASCFLHEGGEKQSHGQMSVMIVMFSLVMCQSYDISVVWFVSHTICQSCDMSVIWHFGHMICKQCDPSVILCISLLTCQSCDVSVRKWVSHIMYHLCNMWVMWCVSHVAC